MSINKTPTTTGAQPTTSTTASTGVSADSSITAFDPNKYRILAHELNSPTLRNMVIRWHNIHDQELKQQEINDKYKNIGEDSPWAIRELGIKTKQFDDHGMQRLMSFQKTRKLVEYEINLCAKQLQEVIAKEKKTSEEK